MPPSKPGEDPDQPKDWYKAYNWEAIIHDTDQFGRDEEKLRRIPAKDFFDYLRSRGAPQQEWLLGAEAQAVQANMSVFDLFNMVNHLRHRAERKQASQSLPPQDDFKRERPAAVWRYVHRYLNEHFRGIPFDQLPLSEVITDMENRQTRHGDLVQIFRDQYSGAFANSMITGVMRQGGRKQGVREMDPMAMSHSQHLLALIDEACPHIARDGDRITAAELITALEPLDHTRTAIIELMKSAQYRNRLRTPPMSALEFAHQLEVREDLLLKHLNLEIPMIGAGQQVDEIDLSEDLVSMEFGIDHLRLRRLAHALLHETELSLPVMLFRDQFSGIAGRSSHLSEVRPTMSDVDILLRQIQVHGLYRRGVLGLTAKDTWNFITEFLLTEGVRMPNPKKDRRKNTHWQRIDSIVRASRND